MGGLGYFVPLLRRDQVDVSGSVLDGQPQQHLERRQVLDGVEGQPVRTSTRDGVGVPALGSCDAGRLAELDICQVVAVVPDWENGPPGSPSRARP